MAEPDDPRRPQPEAPTPFELDLAEPEEPLPPKPQAPAPLPRLWKTEPEPEEPEVVEPPKKKAEPAPRAKAPKTKPKAKKKAAASSEDGSGGAIIEETPVLDTFETRQRIRWVVGGLLGVIGLVGLVIGLRAFRDDQPIEETAPPAEAATGPVAPNARPNREQEAKGLVANARLADKAGRSKAAIDTLKKVTKNYEGTAAAREAAHALDRNRRDLALFGSDQPDQALGPKPPPGEKAVANLSPPMTPSAPPRAVSPGPTAPSPPRTSENGGPTDDGGGRPATAAPAARPLPAGFRARAGAPLHPSGWPSQIVCDRDGAVMILIPAGTFVMGREDGDPDERPAHPVALSTYYIDQHEVTGRQYVQFLRETGRTVTEVLADEYPAVNISAREAKEYCLWARKRLPTEAQWEMAARSTDGRVSYRNGELLRKDPPKGNRTMEPVMSLPSDTSPFGVFDLGANAWEWTSEYYDSHYYQQFRKVVVDPTGPKESPTKLALVTVKGGSKSGILTWREGIRIESRLPYLGFRGALPVEGTIASPASTPPSGTNPALPGGVIPF